MEETLNSQSGGGISGIVSLGWSMFSLIWFLLQLAALMIVGFLLLSMSPAQRSFLYGIVMGLLLCLERELRMAFNLYLRPYLPSYNDVSFNVHMVYSSCQRNCGILLNQILHSGNLSHENYKIIWHWEEPQSVGKSFQFTVMLFNLAGRPYHISLDDKIEVSIRLLDTTVPVNIERKAVDSLADSSTNGVTVQWTVHRAGVYHIFISVGGQHLHGCPHLKEFYPGVPSATQSSVVNPCHLMVCSTHVPFKFTVELRDSFSNSCASQPLPLAENLKLACTHVEGEGNGSAASFSPNPDVHRDVLTPVQHKVSFYPPDPGIYDIRVTWNNEGLTNGHFQLLVVSFQEYSQLSKKISKKSSERSFEIYLMPDTNIDNKCKGKKVYCFITQRQLTIKEYYMKLIPRRLHTFRVSASTQFEFLGSSNYMNKPSLIIRDGFQPPVLLVSTERNLLVAAFGLYLMRNMGGAETFKDKQLFFYKELCKLHCKKSRSSLPVKICRHTLLVDSYKETKSLSSAEWCRSFEITFTGEQGLDYGGLRREWLEQLCIQIFDPSCSSLFMRFKDDPQGLVHPNWLRSPELKLRYYELAGKVVAKCLFESSQGPSHTQMVNAKLTRSLLAQIIGIRVTYQHFEQDDPDLFTTKIKYILENDVSDLDLTFAEEEFQGGALHKVVDLIPNGRNVEVTDENKLQYLDALAQYRLVNRVKPEIEAFLKGLGQLIPDNLLAIFDENELELLMCGSSEISVADFQLHHKLVHSFYPGFSSVIQWFWTIISGFTNEEMARLLQFITGCSQLPPGGFKDLSPLIQIGPSGSHGRLPQAHTCFNHLLLPYFDDMQSMHRALVIAITEGNQGFGLV